MSNIFTEHLTSCGHQKHLKQFLDYKKCNIIAIAGIKDRTQYNNIL